MGGYLSQPVTEKASSHDENEWFTYGAAAMQGWRPEMEDAHMHKLGMGGAEDHGLFGVFDGHGGQEVAIFCAKHLLEELVQMDAYKKQDYATALHETFLRLDKMISDESRWPELREISGIKQEGSVMRLDESELPDYLSRAIAAARQKQREMSDDDDDDSEVEDEVGNPNFDPELQEDSEEYDDRDEDEDDEDQDEEAHEEEGQTNARGGETSSHASEKLGVTQQLPSGRENKEASPSEDEDIMEDDLGLRGQRPQPIDVQVGDQWGDIEYASSRWSDGEGYYSDDYEEYSEDDFDSFEDSSELSWGGKRLNSPVKRPKSKDGKRARGSRPGSSDSRPKSAPQSRPISQVRQRSPSKSMRYRQGGLWSPNTERETLVKGLDTPPLSRAGREAAAAERASQKDADGLPGPSMSEPLLNKDILMKESAQEPAWPASGGAQIQHSIKSAAAGDEKQQVENVAADLGKEDARTAGDVAEDLEDNGAMEGASGDDDAGQDHESSQLGNANEDLNMRWMGGALPGSNDSGLKDSAPTAGCTAVVALVAGKRLLVANAGDSRCVCSRRGEAIAMSEDHKPEHPEELARITKAGAYVSDGRINGSLNLSRAIGDLEFKLAKDCSPEEQAVTAAPDIREIELQDGDEFLVLACDGIWDVMSNQEVVTFVRERILAGDRPVTACEKLCDACLAPDTDNPEVGCDNMSAVVVLLRKFWHD